MKVKPNFWLKASQEAFHYLLYSEHSKLHKGIESVFGPGVEIKDKDDLVYVELSTYYKGKSYGPAFRYCGDKKYYEEKFKTDLYYNINLGFTVMESYRLKGEEIGKFRMPSKQGSYEIQGYFINSKRWFNCIKYPKHDANILGTEYWYIDGELQDFGRILYKDKTYKFVKFNPSNESEYEDVNRKEVDFKSYDGLRTINGISCKTFVKEFKPNIKNKDIIIKITELKEDGELYATDIDIKIKDEVTTLRTYANPEEDGVLYAIITDLFQFVMRKERAVYMYLENDEVIKSIVIYHQSDYFQKYLKGVYTPKYIDDLRRRGITVFGYNKIYSNISDYIKIIDYKLKKYEVYWYDKEMMFSNLNENDLLDGRLLNIRSDGAVFERFYDNGEEISDYEFVEYIKSIDEIDEY